MRSVFRLVLAVALVLGLGLLSCTSTTDGDGDGDGTGEEGTIEWARNLADPVGENWDADAFICFTQGFELDDDGILRGPDTLLAGDSDYWLFWYTLGDETIFIVFVSNDGFTIGYEAEDTVVHYELPRYSNGAVKDLMNTAADEFDENLGDGDYMYRLSLTANETVNLALVEGLEVGGELIVGWILFDADTGQILDTSW